MESGSLSLGVDTGGTFTDIVQIDAAGAVTVDKAFSTPANPEDGAVESLASLARNAQLPVNAVLGATARFAHGTTVSTNALIQRSGAKVGLIATRGFEDTLVIGRGPVGRVGGLPHAKAMDFLHTEPPPALVSRPLVRGIGGASLPGARFWLPSTAKKSRTLSGSWSKAAPKASPSACCGPFSAPTRSGRFERSRPMPRPVFRSSCPPRSRPGSANTSAW